MSDPAQHICQFYLAIKTVKAIIGRCVRIWDTTSLIRGKTAAFAVIALKFGHTSTPHPRLSDTETRLGERWVSFTFHCPVIPGLWSRLRDKGDVYSCREWGSSICMNPTLISCDSLWMYHSSPGMSQEWQIGPHSTCIPVCSAVYIFVCFALMMYSSSLNEWTQCTQSVINQDTSPVGAGGSCRSASSTILIYRGLVGEGCCKHISNCQLHVNCPLGKDSPAQLNHQCTDLANE